MSELILTPFPQDGFAEKPSTYEIYNYCALPSRIAETLGISALGNFDPEAAADRRHNDTPRTIEKIDSLPESYSELRVYAKQLQTEHEQLKHDLLTSPLTGMPNYVAFKNWLAETIERNEDKPLTIGFLDMDGLGIINERFGHDLADCVLRTIGNIISSKVRQDVDMIAAHRSGDEFLVGVNGAPIERIKQIADEALDEIEMLYIKKLPNDESIIIQLDAKDTTTDRSGIYQISASLGFAIKTESMSTEELIKVANKAMYDAKASSNRRIVIRDSSKSIDDNSYDDNAYELPADYCI